MSQPALLLVGAGGHARACIDVIEQEGRWTIAGLIGSPGEVGREVLGYPILGSDDDLARLLGACDHALVTMGQIETPELRMRLFAEIAAAHRVAPPIVSPLAYVSRHAIIGDGTIVMHGALVNAGARVGRNCILNSESLVEHDAVVEDHCHLSTNAALNSGVRVGAGTFVGSTSVVRQGLHIGAGSFIGMGQRIVKSCGPGTRITGANATSREP